MTDGVETERDAFAQRIHEAALGFFDVLSIRLGDRLGLYAALAEGGAATPSELAERAGIAERYAREWLEQQTAAGILRADGAGHGTIRFSLPVGHAEVLLDRDSLSYMTPTVRSLMTLTPVMDALVEAFRSGGGVSWDAYGTDAREAVGDSNRPIYLQVLPRDWLPKIPEIHDRLRTAPPARVADIGCGTGWSSIAIAAAYPGVRVDGFDRDEESLAFARRNAETSGVADRVSFEARDAGEPGDAGEYDVVTFFECLHDMSRPVDALRVARGLLTGDGVVFIADEPTNDEFIGVEDDLDRYHYGWSVFACLPTAMVDPGSAGTGTVMRPSTLRSYAFDAGFSGFDVLPIEDDSFRLYLLRA
jgi:SAM-dependent methyltransferase